MRQNYNEHGVDGYYTTFGAEYKNPHDEPLRKALNTALSKWYVQHALSFRQTLDLACGSGESTLAIEHWCKINHIPSSMVHIQGADPYTHKAYCKRVGRIAEQFSFEDVQEGYLEGRSYSLVISSFALHLLTEKSRLWATIIQLSFVAKYLIVITPHKRPELKGTMGFNLIDEVRAERVRVRLYLSSNFKGLKEQHNDSFITKSNKDGQMHHEKLNASISSSSSLSTKVCTSVSMNCCKGAKRTNTNIKIANSTTNFRDRLCFFWEKHAPEKLANVDRVLSNYMGNEDILIARLVKKYNAEFPTTVPVSEMPPCVMIKPNFHDISIRQKPFPANISGVQACAQTSKNSQPLAAPPSTSFTASTIPMSKEMITPSCASSPFDMVQNLHGILYPPLESTTKAHHLSDAERLANESTANKSLTYGEIRVDSFHQLLCGHVLSKHALTTPWFVDDQNINTVPFAKLPSFMDLGSGSGAAVFAAALSFPFRVCTGVEILQSLHDYAEKSLCTWNSDETFRSSLPDFSQKAMISFRCADLATAAEELSDINIGFANSTLFDSKLMQRLAETAGNMQNGSLFITFSKDLPCASWTVLERYQAMMSWGVCVVIIQRKITEGYHPVTSGKFYSNRDDHTYAPSGDPGAFLHSIVAAAHNRSFRTQGNIQSMCHDDEQMCHDDKPMQALVASVWPSMSTQIKVLQKLRKCGIYSVHKLRNLLGDNANVNVDTVAINCTLRERGFKAFGFTTLRKMWIALSVPK